MHAVCGKPWEKASLILVTLTSRSDSNFERSTLASKKINRMALIQTLTVSTTAFDRTKEKFYGFRQVGKLFLRTKSLEICLKPYKFKTAMLCPRETFGFSVTLHLINLMQKLLT